MRAIGHPEVMRVRDPARADHPTLMRFTLKLLANLTDERGRGRARNRLTPRHEPRAAASEVPEPVLG